MCLVLYMLCTIQKVAQSMNWAMQSLESILAIHELHALLPKPNPNDYPQIPNQIV